MRFDKLEFEPDPQDPRRKPAPRQDEKDHEHWVRSAQDQRRSGCYEMALRYYSRALELEKSLVVAWTGQVQMLVMMREYPQAALWSRKALELFPGNSELLAGQAQAECRQGRLKEAMAASDASLAARGESAYRWQVRGELMIVSRSRNDRQCFDKAQIVDNDWLVPLESALIYCEHSGYSLAQQRAQLAVERAPQAPYAWYVLGTCQRHVGFDTAAARSFERCLELAPNHADAGTALAEIEGGGLSLGRMFRRIFGRG